MFLRKPAREKAEINGSSMADIAFLLLIFFLVTTTINVDTGIGLVLPPPLDEDAPPIHERNLMNILVNSEGEIMMDDHLTEIHEVKGILKTFINNWGENPALSDSPEKAVISLKTQRATPYQVYVDMLDEVMAAYKEVRNEASIANYGITFDKLREGSDRRNHIKELYKKRISIADSE
ncbi:MAG: biopolymer transporter ExbD [Balneolaceae bacterium]|nr:biopolymer transporter ExbD [Balneolaceae bacterium]MBO6547399.1 biopolymer transporter ExbD [Balneolaceae bacterium]MBO6647654.1 biopolymer transporter ExbD [Balneolaceae bacterium]